MPKIYFQHPAVNGKKLLEVRPALVVELGDVGGEGCVLERPAGEPGVEAAERPGVRPAGVRAEGPRSG